MNWDSFQGKFKQLEGAMREQWAKLSTDDMEHIAGQRERLAGRIQDGMGSPGTLLRNRLTNGGREFQGADQESARRAEP